MITISFNQSWFSTGTAVIANFVEKQVTVLGICLTMRTFIKEENVRPLWPRQK